MQIKQLKELWQEHGFRSKKSLGQNFLIDNNVRDNLIKELSITKESMVVEIGPGFGAMTFSLADKCGKLIAIEKDSRISSIMEPLLLERGNIQFIHDDILEVDLCGLADDGSKLIVFGNVPYYISTPIIEKMIAQRQCIKDVYLVMQEELVDRIVSPPGTRQCGSISHFIQFYTKTEKLFKIRKNSFCPPPKVESSLLKLEFLPNPSVLVKDEELMFKIIRKSFSQRRKKAINPLGSGNFLNMDKTEWLNIFNKCGIDPSNRAEALTLNDYAKIADEVITKRGTSPNL